MNKISPLGWQNLSTTRHKVRDHELVLPEIRESYSTAIEKTHPSGIFTYWADVRLIGLSWNDGMWWYVVMPQLSYELGVDMSIVDTDNRVRILATAQVELILSDEKVTVAAERKPRETHNRQQGSIVIPDNILEYRIDDSGLYCAGISFSVRAINCLKSDAILTFGELSEKTENDLMKLDNFGRKTLDEIKTVLGLLGLQLKETITQRLARRLARRRAAASRETVPNPHVDKPTRYPYPDQGCWFIEDESLDKPLGPYKTYNEMLENL